MGSCRCFPQLVTNLNPPLNLDLLDLCLLNSWDCRLEPPHLADLSLNRPINSVLYNMELVRHIHRTSLCVGFFMSQAQDTCSVQLCLENVLFLGIQALCSCSARGYPKERRIYFLQDAHFSPCSVNLSQLRPSATYLVEDLYVCHHCQVSECVHARASQLERKVLLSECFWNGGPCA